ncbi:hypothetical protein GYMLUDRAFT_682863 [Collybiopsis luxurians FD-317 M1]|uniref:Uncharacterized protein n=1 Tax=Collybiopsis luxurians FD-317 M1 TaxID=944289 RepID=A0A0D0BUG5_9AGAR|nr:hypothetical protein GYMLUDRAFT_682863 [Collybiopsis luxurians FD-317 M1]
MRFSLSACRIQNPNRLTNIGPYGLWSCTTLRRTHCVPLNGTSRRHDFPGCRRATLVLLVLCSVVAHRRQFVNMNNGIAPSAGVRGTSTWLSSLYRYRRDAAL